MQPADNKALPLPDPHPTEHWIENFQAIRERTLRICAPLEIEDHIVQPVAEVSPPKWHLGHTTWFFEKFILEGHLSDYRPFDDRFPLIFNSYYKSIGKHWLQQERGALSRPTVKEVLAYRSHVDEAIVEFLNATMMDAALRSLMEVGLNHEQQHQELLLMDIKYILGANPLQPRYTAGGLEALSPGNQASWRYFEPGLHEIGANAYGFSYDNERPRHKAWLHGFSISSHLVSNREFLEFITDDGYTEPGHWLSKGWDWVCSRGIRSPLYWFEEDGQWHEYTLHGPRPLDHNAPVCHISYFEADAFARWRGCRLPAEQEMEIQLRHDAADGKEGIRTPGAFGPESEAFHPWDTRASTRQLWCWTQSHYSPYPGFKEFEGKLGEYNGKFMCNQFVLKGGSLATPPGHYRHSYRNFFEPHQRWMFSGIRLARD